MMQVIPQTNQIWENIRTQSKARENAREGASINYEDMPDWLTRWRAFAHPIISREGYANATTSTSKHTCELSRGKTENKLTRWCKRWKIFHFLTITWQDFRSTKLFLVLWSSVRLTNYIADVSRSFGVLGTNSNQEANSCKHKYEKTISGILSLRYIFEIRHFTNEKGNEAVMCPAAVSGIFTGNALVSYWPVFFPVPCNSARSLLKPSFLK